MAKQPKSALAGPSKALTTRPANKPTRKKSDKKAKSKPRGKGSWKVLESTASLLAGLATTKALDATWRTATGKPPPNKPESPLVADREALMWAALSGMALGVARIYATRRVANYWMRSFGSVPPGMSKDAAKKTKKKDKKAA